MQDGHVLMPTGQYQGDGSGARLPHEQVQGETQGSMDEVEPKAQEADLTRGVREYVWFAIALLCIVALVVIKSHT
jgi:hypothetical protein